MPVGSMCLTWCRCVSFGNRDRPTGFAHFSKRHLLRGYSASTPLCLRSTFVRFGQAQRGVMGCWTAWTLCTVLILPASSLPSWLSGWSACGRNAELEWSPNFQASMGKSHNDRGRKSKVTLLLVFRGSSSQAFPLCY